MGIASLGSRAIIGEFYRLLAQDIGAGWIPGISMLFNSDQESETYKWLGMVPAMREWIGKRHAKGFFDNGVTIANKKYEATLEVLLEDLRRDKTSQTMIRVAELVTRTQSHWAKLLSALMIAGEATTCYDGQYFFDTDHVEGNNSTSQSNDLSIDISALPAAVHGSTTTPSPEEAALVVLQCIEAIYGFKDNENEPMNETSQNFLVMCPIPLFSSFAAAVQNKIFAGGATNTLANSNFNVDIAANARLTWTEQIVVYRTDGSVKPFIRQEETPVSFKAVAEGSELEFNEDIHHYGVSAQRNVGYGYWQHACMATMT